MSRGSRRFRRLAVIAISLALLLSCWLYRNREPRYHGVPASEYVLGLIGPKTLPNKSPHDGILKMGPAVAVPALIRVIEAEDSAPARSYEILYSKLPLNMRNPFPAPRDRNRIMAVAWSALAQFGADASASVPALIKMYKRNKSRVIFTLNAIGPPASNAIPVIIAGLHPTNSFCYATASALWRIDPSGDLTTAAFAEYPARSALQRAIGDHALLILNTSHTASRWSALELSSCIRSEPARIAPVLVKYFQDDNERIRAKAAEALGRFGPAVREYAKDIQPLLLDDWQMVRQAATNALHAIELRRP